MTTIPEDHAQVCDGDILVAEELARRPARSPDLAAENDALHALARLLIDQPDALQRQLAETALELCAAGSAGVSLLEVTPEGTVFRWTALAGRLAPYEGGSTPRNFSPCGLCLDRGEPILVARPARRFPYFNDVDIPIVEGLVLPLYGAGKRPLGTMWIAGHTSERRFDREDVRVMTRLADFTALAIESAAVRDEATKGERRARELLDALPAAIYTTDAAGRVTYYNGAAADLAGRQPRLGRDEWCVTWRLYRPDGAPLPLADCPMAVALKENRPLRGQEVIAERPDRTRVSLMPYPTPLHDASGKLIGAVNMLVDISERKRAEAALRENEQRLRATHEGAPVGICETDPTTGRFLRVNESFCRITGYSGEELNRLSIADLTHPEDIEKDLGHHRRQMTGEITAYQMEKRYVHKDGHIVWVELSASAVRDMSGMPIYGIRIVQDITERRRAEDALRASEERFRAIIDQATVGIAQTDLTGRFVLLNDRYCQILGYPRDELLQRKMQDLTHPQDLPHNLEPFQRLAADDVPFVIEKRYIRGDGSVVWVHSTVSTVHDASGKPRWAVAVTLDITERKRAEALTECQRQALQMLAEGAPLDDVLAFLVRMTESHAAKGMIGSILLLNEAGTHFERGIGPSLPAEFNAAVAGIAVSSAIGVCCHAVSRREPVVAADFTDDPMWMRFAEFVAPYRLRAGWSTPIFGADGRVLGTFANYYRRAGNPTPQDMQWVEIVTRTAAIAIERARAEATVRESRENLTAALAASETGTFRWNPHTGEFLEFDDNLKRLFGIALGAPVQVTEDFIAPVHPDDRPALVPAVDACRDGADFSMEYRVILPDGGIRWLYDRAKMERDAYGNPTYLVGACTDITKRKEAEERLRENEELFRTLADSIPALAWMADPDGSIFWYNRGWYDYTGTALEEMQGWGWQSVHDPEVLPSVLGRWRSSLATGAPFEMVFPLRGSDGILRPFLTRVVPMRAADGHITRWFGTNTDISRQREIQLALQRLNDLLESEIEERTRALEAEMAERQKAEAALQQARRLEAVGRLTGGVAHDFNNTLTVILGQSEQIIAEAADENIRRRAAAIQHAAERGAQLNRQLLAFSRNQQLHPERVGIDRLTANIDPLVRRAVDETVEVEYRAEQGLWPILVDPAQFESALLNLVINARDAMPDGGKLIVELRNQVVSQAEATSLDVTPGDYVVAAVTDTGIGMSSDIRGRAFDPFFTTKDVGEGTGLGLAQVYGFVRQSGGGSRIESMVGRGTTVSLYLPRAEAEVQKPTPANRAAPVDGRGKTVLVVEDQPEVREVIQALLSDLGYKILTASDGVEARGVLQSEVPIDLLLTDIVMPNGVSGIDLAEGARRLRQDLKVVLVSGYSRDLKISPEGAHPFVFLEKPFRQAELAASIAAALNGGG